MQVSADDVARTSPTSDERLGGIAVQLALKFPEWIERRVEHVSYLDRDMTRKAQGVMFRWRRPDFFLAGATPQRDELVCAPGSADQGATHSTSGHAPGRKSLPDLAIQTQHCTSGSRNHDGRLGKIRRDPQRPLARR